MPWSSYTLQCNNNIIWLNSVRTFRRFRLWHIDIYFNNKKSWQIEIIESWVPSWLTAVLHRLKSCNITSSTWLERTLQPVMVNSHGNWFISCTDHSSWAFIIATASVWLSCFLFSPCLGHVTFFTKHSKTTSVCFWPDLDRVCYLLKPEETPIIWETHLTTDCIFLIHQTSTLLLDADGSVRRVRPSGSVGRSSVSTENSSTVKFAATVCSTANWQQTSMIDNIHAARMGHNK